MPRVVSFIVLVGVLLFIGAMFFRVVLQFAVPLFLAAVLVVIFKPVHKWLLRKLPGRPRLAALATSAVILLLVLAPSILMGWNAYIECRALVEAAQDDEQRGELLAVLEKRGGNALAWFEATFGTPLDVKALLEAGTAAVGSAVLSSVQTLLGLLIGLAIMTLSVYYFFLDGPSMILAIMKLSPLDNEYERELLEKFANVSRAVVLASFLSAIVQGLLAGIGYYFALTDEAPVALLTLLTMLFSLVPFVGAAAVWVPTVVVVFFYQPAVVEGVEVRGDTFHAVALAIYCAAIVSTIDNFIKPWVLHGQSNMHPLLALISVLGGVQVLGPLGILVGPMLVAFVQALLTMVNKELKNFDGSPPTAIS